MGDHTYETQSHGSAIAVRPLHSSIGGAGGLCVRNGDSRGLWATLSPTLEAWAGVAVRPEARHHADIVRKVTAAGRELWIAREVSCTSCSSETVSVLWRLSNEKRHDTELLMELARGSNGGRSHRHESTHINIRY